MLKIVFQQTVQPNEDLQHRQLCPCWRVVETLQLSAPAEDLLNCVSLLYYPLGGRIHGLLWFYRTCKRHDPKSDIRALALRFFESLRQTILHYVNQRITPDKNDSVAWGYVNLMIGCVWVDITTILKNMMLQSLTRLMVLLCLTWSSSTIQETCQCGTLLNSWNNRWPNKWWRPWSLRFEELARSCGYEEEMTETELEL